MLVENRAYNEIEPRLQALVMSDEPMERAQAAEMGAGMEVLVYDEDPYVRYLCARNEYGYNVLASDEDWRIVELIHYRLDREKIDLDAWCEKNPAQVVSPAEVQKPSLIQQICTIVRGPEPHERSWDLGSISAQSKKLGIEHAAYQPIMNTPRTARVVR